MKKRMIFLLIMMMLFSIGARAQGALKCGKSFADAIPVTISGGQLLVTDMRDTDSYDYSSYKYISPYGGYQWTDGNAVYYRLKTCMDGDVEIHNWYSSRVGFSSLFLVAPLDPSKEPNWDYDCNSVYEVQMSYPGTRNWDAPQGQEDYGYLYVHHLPAGIYYIIVAGYKGSNGSVSNGELRTTIYASLERKSIDESSSLNECEVQYQYDLSGNRIKTFQK